MLKVAMVKTATSLAGNNDFTQGYSLIELLVVLVIVVAVMSTVAPQFSFSNDRRELAGTGRQLAAALRQTRSDAIAFQRENIFALDLEGYSYQSGKNGSVSIPKRFALALYTADSELLGEGRGAIRFFADGSSSGGQITLTASSASEVIVVDWLTGKVVINERTIP